MAVLFWSFLIWALSSLVGASYMSRRLKEPTAARLAVTLIPVVNTLFALIVIIFAFRIRRIGRIGRIEIKSIIKEFKDIKNDNL